MNKIEQELQNLIVVAVYKDDNNFEEEATKNSYSLLEKYTIGFAKWCIKNYCCEILFSGLWYERNSENETEYTEEELFNLYIKTL